MVSLHVAYDGGYGRRIAGSVRKAMKRDRRPAKRLAPTPSPEDSCPHEFTGAEGLQLEVNCEACGGAQDLLNRRCLAGLVNVVVRNAVPDTIILKRFMHKRYRNETVRLVADAASELAALTRVLGSASTPSDRKCRTCPCNAVKLIAEMRMSLLQDPEAYLLDSGFAESLLDGAVSRSGCERARECAEKAWPTRTAVQGRAR